MKRENGILLTSLKSCFILQLRLLCLILIPCCCSSAFGGTKTENPLNLLRFEKPDNTVQQEYQKKIVGYESIRLELPSCKPNDQYIFSGQFYREDRLDKLAYPSVSIWGKEYTLNHHRLTGKFQHLKVLVTCDEEIEADRHYFEFSNKYPSTKFYLLNPMLFPVVEKGITKLFSIKTKFYPIGIYGAPPDKLYELKRIGFNTSVLPLRKENVQSCLKYKMRCTFAVDRNLEKLQSILVENRELLEGQNFLYYVNDEPEIHSFSESVAANINKTIKETISDAVTSMAIVRPHAIPFYEKGADFFMLDQYPVPNMPMTWLSESMDEAATYVGQGRLMSVIQAFGGDAFATSGWPRMPTFEEMNCLAFLSVIHGSRGVFFYSYPFVESNPAGLTATRRVVRRLNSMKSWLEAENLSEPVLINMTSKYKFDPAGSMAVHCVRKEQRTTQVLICVNTIRTYTEANIETGKNRSTIWREYYGDEKYIANGGNVSVTFDPLEVKVLLEQ